MTSKRFKNTWAEHVRNEELTVEQIIFGLFRQVFKYKELPAEVQDAVDKEMDRRSGR